MTATPRRERETVLYTTENILKIDADVIVNPVNTTGLLTAGLSKAIVTRYPGAYRSYLGALATGRLRVGKVHLYQPRKGRAVLSLPTKRSVWKQGTLAYVEAGLQDFAHRYNSLGIHSIAFPMLGCGHAGLDWDQVKPLMEHHLKPLKNIEITISTYQPLTETDHKE